jgi:hypothetical protein
VIDALPTWTRVRVLRKFLKAGGVDQAKGLARL